jgi:hypothetical protein
VRRARGREARSLRALSRPPPRIVLAERSVTKTVPAPKVMAKPKATRKQRKTLCTGGAGATGAGLRRRGSSNRLVLGGSEPTPGANCPCARGEIEWAP